MRKGGKNDFENTPLFSRHTSIFVEKMTYTRIYIRHRLLGATAGGGIMTSRVVGQTMHIFHAIIS